MYEVTLSKKPGLDGGNVGGEIYDLGLSHKDSVTEVKVMGDKSKVKQFIKWYTDNGYGSVVSEGAIKGKRGIRW